MNILKKFLTNQKGFTLAEILAVAGILIVLTGVVGGILVATLRGSNKTRITTSGAQNGNYVVSVLTNAISNSKEFGYIDAANVRQTACVPPLPDYPTPPPLTPAPISITKLYLKNFDDTYTQIECKDSGAGFTFISTPVNSLAATPTVAGSSLINTSEVVLSSCNQVFTCSQQDEFSPPKLDLNFTLIDKNSSEFFEQQTASPFRTSISIRNYQR
jgi:type II secretory pathway pseudopilin PulG